MIIVIIQTITSISSQTKILALNATIEAARGNIVDRNENVLATTKTGYSVELYKTKSSNEELNSIAKNLEEKIKKDKNKLED